MSKFEKQISTLKNKIENEKNEINILIDNIKLQYFVYIKKYNLECQFEHSLVENEVCLNFSFITPKKHKENLFNLDLSYDLESKELNSNYFFNIFDSDLDFLKDLSELSLLFKGTLETFNDNTFIELINNCYSLEKNKLEVEQLEQLTEKVFESQLRDLISKHLPNIRHKEAEEEFKELKKMDVENKNVTFYIKDEIRDNIYFYPISFTFFKNTKRVSIYNYKGTAIRNYEFLKLLSKQFKFNGEIVKSSKDIPMIQPQDNSENINTTKIEVYKKLINIEKIQSF